MDYVKKIEFGGMKGGHVQGIATDKERRYMYFSFTTSLIKTDMQGNIIGSVKGLAGHLGCIAYNYEDGRVYGSLEFKHDIIGADILRKYENPEDIVDGFYVAIFDVDKIDRIDMDAEKDGIMTSVFLKEVYDDYSAEGHRYSCSGIDGLTFAPAPASKEDKKYLYVAYGVYSNVDKTDNDNQVILKYDISDWSKYEKPLNQLDMHRTGPEKPDNKYFLYTGNTNFGIQNLEFDAPTGYIFAAVYKGYKPSFPNYPMFVIDMNTEAKTGQIKGLEEEGEMLSLAEIGLKHEETGVRGLNFPLGATGIISLGDGYFYFSRDVRFENGLFGSYVTLYKYENGEFTEA
ncbi:MAG: hypothetical protein IKB86_02635 [Clostridia bacterium]|nr:hypothetical protein [Clostridia bacterium]